MPFTGASLFGGNQFGSLFENRGGSRFDSLFGDRPAPPPPLMSFSTPQQAPRAPRAAPPPVPMQRLMDPSGRRGMQIGTATPQAQEPDLSLYPTVRAPGQPVPAPAPYTPPEPAPGAGGDFMQMLRQLLGQGAPAAAPAAPAAAPVPTSAPGAPAMVRSRPRPGMQTTARQAAPPPQAPTMSQSFMRNLIERIRESATPSMVGMAPPQAVSDRMPPHLTPNQTPQAPSRLDLLLGRGKRSPGMLPY